MLGYASCRYPVVHVLLGVRRQDQGPPLLGALRRVDGEGEVSLTQQRDQRRHVLQRHLKVLRDDKVLSVFKVGR